MTKIIDLNEKMLWLGLVVMLCGAWPAKGDFMKDLSAMFFGGSSGDVDSSRYYADPKIAAFIDDVQRDNAKSVKAGLAAGINANIEGKEGFRPIFFVFFARDTDVLQLLLAAGGNPNARLLNGNTPLHFSVRNENPEFTRLLLAAGANPNVPGENKKPPIHEAVNQVEAASQIKLLAAAGADVNVVWGGGTPAMNALEIGQWRAAQSLIDAGADLGIKNHFGETALILGCQFIKGLPDNTSNKKGIKDVVESLKRRHLEFPCEADVAKFL